MKDFEEMLLDENRYREAVHVTNTIFSIRLLSNKPFYILVCKSSPEHSFENKGNYFKVPVAEIHYRHNFTL